MIKCHWHVCSEHSRFKDARGDVQAYVWKTPIDHSILNSGSDKVPRQFSRQPGRWWSLPTSSKEEMPASLHFKELLQKLNEYQVRYPVKLPCACSRDSSSKRP